MAEYTSEGRFNEVRINEENKCSKRFKISEMSNEQF